MELHSLKTSCRSLASVMDPSVMGDPTRCIFFLIFLLLIFGVTALYKITPLDLREENRSEYEKIKCWMEIVSI